MPDIAAGRPAHRRHDAPVAPIEATFDRTLRAWKQDLGGGVCVCARDLPQSEAWEIWATDGELAVRRFIDHGRTLREALAAACLLAARLQAEQARTAD